MIEVTSNSIRELIESNEVVLLDFYAPWCAPCKSIMPILESVESELPHVTFAKVNVDDEGDIAAEYEIMSVPTVVILHKGEATHKVTGVPGINELIDTLRGGDAISE
jgi:thioredoxin 1